MNTQPIKLCARTDIPEGEMIEMSVPGTDNSLLLVSTKGAIRAFRTSVHIWTSRFAKAPLMVK